MYNLNWYHESMDERKVIKVEPRRERVLEKPEANPVVVQGLDDDTKNVEVPEDQLPEPVPVLPVQQPMPDGSDA